MPVALITGAASGIGRASAVEFARRGYDVSVVDLLGEELAQAAGAVRQFGRAVETHVGDLADLGFAEASVRETVQRFGRLDVLVHCAVWREAVPMRAITVASWERTLRVCLTTPAFMARWAAETMRGHGGGVIVNVSSILSQRAIGISPAYVASKGGLDALTYELAAAYAADGIRVLAINPGAVDTASSRDYTDAEGQSITDDLRSWSEDMIPAGRWAQPEEIARMIALLASEDASYVTGANLIVDGGWSHSHFPQSLLRRMQKDRPA